MQILPKPKRTWKLIMHPCSLSFYMLSQPSHLRNYFLSVSVTLCCTTNYYYKIWWIKTIPVLVLPGFIHVAASAGKSEGLEGPKWPHWHVWYLVLAATWEDSVHQMAFYLPVSRSFFSGSLKVAFQECKGRNCKPLKSLSLEFIQCHFCYTLLVKLHDQPRFKV